MPQAGAFFYGQDLMNTNVDLKTAEDSDSTRLAAIQDCLRGGDTAQAQRLVEQWLDAAPDHTEALYFKAVIARVNKDVNAALDTLKRLLGQTPSHSRALQEIAHCHRQRNDHRLAATYYQRATRANPSLAASWLGLSQAHMALGNQRAASLARAQYDFLKGLPSPLVIVMDLRARGRLLQAEELCKRFLQKNPSHVEGMRLLSDIAIELGALDEAKLLLDTAEQIAPGNERVKVEQINLARKKHNHAAALDRAEALVSLYPDNLQYRSLAAVAALQIGNFESALTGFDKVLDSLPNDPVTLTSRGHALKTIGRTNDAIADYRAAVTAQPEHGEAWYALSNLKTYTFSDSDIVDMEALCNVDSLDAKSQPFLHFALGKAY